MKKKILSLLLLSIALSCKTETKTTTKSEELPEKIDAHQSIRETPHTTGKKDHQIRRIQKAKIPPIIDGIADDAIWDTASWHDLDQKWIGDDYTPQDFSGKFKLSWSAEALYLLVEITDDILRDQYKDPLERWWDDDCVEIFVDADNSGGNHLFTHNAFAYHVALDGNVVDMSPEEKGALYNDHVLTKRITKGTTTIWEHQVFLFDDKYIDGQSNTPMILVANQKIGFSLAYCDNDTSKEREHFIGSAFVPGEDKNQGYIDADTFGTLLLTE